MRSGIHRRVAPGGRFACLWGGGGHREGVGGVPRGGEWGRE